MSRCTSENDFFRCPAYSAGNLMNALAWTPTTTLAVYCVLILFASLAGGWIPLMVRLTHTRVQVATSFVSGLMLGVGVLHLLPHAWHEMPSIDRVAGWLLAGFLVVFLLQRFFHFHHHDVAEEDPEGCDGHPAACDHTLAPQGAEHHVHHDHTLAGKSARQISWWGAAMGLSLHTLIAGMALGASVAAGSTATQAGLTGLGTFLVIFLHKPFDAMVISTLMTVGGWSRRSRHVVNGLFALAIPAGVILFEMGAAQVVETEAAHTLIGSALAFAAGTFICIAASDLLPELQFHSHDRAKLTVALGLGLTLALMIGSFEATGHDHGEATGHDHDEALPHEPFETTPAP